MAVQLSDLKKLVEEATQKLSDVQVKRMFGSDAFFRKDSIFALIWKEGRIGVRLPKPEVLEKLLAMRGAGPWKAGPMTMANWAFVPEQMHQAREDLKTWLKQAYEMATGSDKKKKASSKKAANKPKLSASKRLSKKSQKNVPAAKKKAVTIKRKK